MVESYSFAEGRILGGSVLLRESLGSLTRRRNLSTLSLLAAIMAVFIFFVVVAFFFSLGPIPDPIEFIGGILGVAAYWGIFVVFFARRYKRGISRFVVYREGVSMGYGDFPFYRFSDIYHVEEVNYLADDIFKTHLCLTFRDGTFKTFPKDLFHNEEVYSRFHARMRSRLSELNRGLPWSSEVEDMLSGLTYEKGPVRYAIESYARVRGQKEIGLQFVKAYWREITEDPKYHPEEFAELAKKQWG